MTTYRIGADRTGGAQACLDTVCETISAAGHDVKNLGVDSNSEHKFGEGAKTDIGVYVVNGVCLGTIHSTYDDIIKTGKANTVIFALVWQLFGSGNVFNKASDLTDSSKKLRVVHDGTNWPQSYYDDDGKWTVDEAFKQFDGIEYVYGDTCKDVAQAILDGNFGGTGEGGDDDSESTSSEGETKPMSGWESLCDLIKPYDGQIFMTVRGDTVIVKKITIPEWTAIWAYEGVNVVDDSVSVTDYSPEIYNTIEVKYGNDYENTIELCFERHKELFGERKTTILANKKVSEEEYNEYQKSLKESEEESSKAKGGTEKPKTQQNNNNDGNSYIVRSSTWDTHSTSVSGNLPNPANAPTNPFTSSSPLTLQGTSTNNKTITNANIKGTSSKDKVYIQRKQQQDKQNKKILNTINKGKVIVKKYYQDKTS